MGEIFEGGMYASYIVFLNVFNVFLKVILRVSYHVGSTFHGNLLFMG